MHCYHYPELLEKAEVATVDSIVPMEEGVPRDPTTVLVAGSMVVAHTLEWEYGNLHAAPQMGVQMMLRGSLNWGHQQPWKNYHSPADVLS